MEQVFPVIQKTNGDMGNVGYIVWFFFLEYWRNFFKRPDPYKVEEEVRFVVSENYSLFLHICSMLSKWGLFNTKHPEELSQAFNEQHLRIKQQLHVKLKFCKADNNIAYVSVPLYEILDSVTIGPNSSITKSQIIQQTNHKIKKSKINKSFSLNPSV
ncbi:MAG: hypothetical protein ACXWE6_14505, partial [Nitrososphaeraceae archaeon]